MSEYIINDVSFGATYFCSDDKLILDTAEENGLDYPYSDRAGAGSSSIAFKISGTLIDDGFFYQSRLGLPDFSIRILLIRQAT